MKRRGQVSLAALIAVMVLTLIAPAGALAQTTSPVIESATLQLWPEYDDPGLLVILTGSFNADSTMPLAVSFPVPAGTRNVQATFQDSSGSLINRPFELRDGRLLYELPSPGFHVEYYLDRAPSGEQRNITYTFEAPYPINTLNVSVQQPARATGFALTPAAESSSASTDGLTYHQLTRRNLAQGEKVDITIAYNKSDTGLTAPLLAVTSTSAAQGDAAAAPSAAAGGAADILPWLLIGLGAALLVAILAYWLITQRREQAAVIVTRPEPRPVRPPAAAPRARAVTPADSATTGAAAFCTNCGSALRPDDRFCAQCGAPRRS
jgi:hypothetical protein